MASFDKYLISPPIFQVFVDKTTGKPLDGGTIECYRDSAPNEAKNLFQLIGSPPNYSFTPLPNPIQLSSAGMPTDANGEHVALYANPYDVNGDDDKYYLIIRDKFGVQQTTREAWPSNKSEDSKKEQNFFIQNQISNSQFTRVLINNYLPTIYSVVNETDKPFNLGPGWDFVISGTGSVTVQRINISGNEKIITSPPFVLDISVSSGITSCYLQQRFIMNSGLWSSTINQSLFLSSALVVRNENSGTVPINMLYHESNGGIPVNIFSGSFDNSGYQLVTGSSINEIPFSTSIDSGNAGHIDILISLPANCHIRLTSVQVIPSLIKLSEEDSTYQVQSSNQNYARMSDYYLPRLEQRPVRSLLTGWDFCLNPCQFGSSGTITTSPNYILDQTIASCSTVGTVSFSKNITSGGLQFNTTGNNGAFYIMQYKIGSDAKKLFDSALCSFLKGYLSAGSSNVSLSIYLFRAASTSSIPILPLSIGGVSNDGQFTLNPTAIADGWSEVPRSNLGRAFSMLNSFGDPELAKHPFSGWNITEASQFLDTDKYAFVVTFSYEKPSEIIINSVSLCNGEIPTPPAYQSPEEVLKECEYYFEKSYLSSDGLGTITLAGQIISPQLVVVHTGANTVGFLGKEISFNYKTTKLKKNNYILSGNTPNIAFFSPTTGDSSVFDAHTRAGGIATSRGDINMVNWTPLNINDSNAILVCTSPNEFITSGILASTQAASAYVAFHYLIDSRLGIL